MIRKTFTAFCFGVMAYSVPVSAQDVQYAYDRPIVNPLPGNGNFEVIQRGNAAAARAWCDAANYATRYLGANGGDRIFLMTREGPAVTRKRSLGVGFTLHPDASLQAKAFAPGDGGNYSVTIYKEGFNLSVGHAKGHCSRGRLG